MNIPEAVAIAILEGTSRAEPYKNLFIHKEAYPQFRMCVQPWEVTITKDGMLFMGVEVHVRHDPLNVWRLK